jgi:hypothetical protein
VSKQGERSVVSMIPWMLRGPFGLLPAAIYLLLAAPVAAADLAPSPPFLPQPSLYVIEGYLDRAAQGIEIRDRIEISVDGRRRTLLVTRYGTPGQTGLDRYLSRVMAKPFTIKGTSENVERLIAAPPGTKIAGTFAAYTQGSPWLLIQDLTEPAPDS